MTHDFAVRCFRELCSRVSAGDDGLWMLNSLTLEPQGIEIHGVRIEEREGRYVLDLLLRDEHDQRRVFSRSIGAVGASDEIERDPLGVSHVLDSFLEDATTIRWEPARRPSA